MVSDGSLAAEAKDEKLRAATCIPKFRGLELQVRDCLSGRNGRGGDATWDFMCPRFFLYRPDSCYKRASCFLARIAFQHSPGTLGRKVRAPQGSQLKPDSCFARPFRSISIPGLPTLRSLSFLSPSITSYHHHLQIPPSSSHIASLRTIHKPKTLSLALPPSDISASSKPVTGRSLSSHVLSCWR